MSSREYHNVEFCVLHQEIIPDDGQLAVTGQELISTVVQSCAVLGLTVFPTVARLWAIDRFWVFRELAALARRGSIRGETRCGNITKRILERRCRLS